jgi:hypothetical protein
MASPPALLNVPLQPCCQKALAEIKDTLRRGGAFRGLVATGGLWALVGSAPLDTLVSVTTTDWSLFAQATQGADAVVKNACRNIAFDEYQKHPGGRLNQFWEAVLANFE